MQAMERAAEAARQEEADSEARTAAAAQAQAREFERERERAAERMERERREFGGCYSAVLEAILQPLPKQVAPASVVLQDCGECWARITFYRTVLAFLLITVNVNANARPVSYTSLLYMLS